MRQFFLAISLLTSFGASSQTIKEANRWFDSYEYAKAASIYEQVNPATIEDYQRWCYSYFITGEYEKCMPLADSIVRRIDTPSFFYYAHGYSAMALGDYPTAIESLQEYKKLDDEFNVDMLIVSCQQIPTWKGEAFVEKRLASHNSDKSDFAGQFYKDGFVEFHESGVDSLKGSITGGNFETAELLLIRPFTRSTTDDLLLVSFPDSLSDASISSFTYDQKADEVLFTASRHLEQEGIKRAPHIYTGRIVGQEVTNIQPWKYAGYQDTSSTAHATVNASGNLLVFSKLGSITLSSDLYVSKKVNNEWTAPEPMSALNTEFDEMYPLFMGDTLLSFASEGRPGYGGLDIYLAKMNGDLVTEVTHPKSPVNSFQDDFNFVYYSADSARFSSNRYGGAGDDDIYFIKFKESVIDDAPDSTDFYAFVDNWVDPIIYFDFDKFDLNNNVEKLNDLIAFLTKHEKSTVHIEGHTDRRGTEDYNVSLGKDRAEVVKDELVRQGVRASQITTVSKGKTEPQVDCSNGCTEAQHALNRVAIIRLKAK